jgi:hypothetical protein
MISPATACPEYEIKINKLGLSCAKLRFNCFPTEAELILTVEFQIWALLAKT